jgi:hypothetical protein
MRCDDRRGLAIFSALFLSLAILGVGVLILLDDLTHLFQYSYLIPWILLVFVVVCIPVIYLIIRGSFGLFHPLVYAAWIYFLPAFVLGSLCLATGLRDPWFMVLIPNPEHYLPLTLIYIALGFAGLTLGFAVPLGRRIGGAIARKLPAWDWEVSDLFRPAMFLVIIGELFKLGAFANANLGYQYTEDPSTFGATLNVLGLLSAMGSFLLWFAIFRAKRLMLRHYLIALLLLALIVYTMVLGGGRGTLFSSTVLFIGAYVFSRRRIKLRQALLIALLIVGALFVGMAYGTVFRQIKGNEAQMRLQEYLGIGSMAFDQLSSQGFEENLSLSADAFLQRIETVSQLAVYVANYERLQSAEASYGIADIWTMTWTAFIPRAIWPDKPTISGARGLGLLYFNIGNSSPTVSPMIDLLRNFGPIGVSLGMALLGIVLRIMYSALIHGQRTSAWRTAGYYLLLTNVSYEGMYGSILPVLIRVCVVFSVGLAFLYVMMPRRGGTRAVDGFRGK